MKKVLLGLVVVALAGVAGAALAQERFFQRRAPQNYDSMNVGYDGRPFNFYLYDAYGRTTYFRYTQSF